MQDKKVYLILPFVLLLIIFTGLIGWLIGKSNDNDTLSTPLEIIKPRTLDKYSFDNLIEHEFITGIIEIIDTFDEKDEFNSYLIKFTHDPDLDGENDKVTTGLLNIPNGSGRYPIIVMLRGYVDQSIYQTGMGTSKAGEVFAENGYITIAPDFLGYAGSDENSSDILESRFQTYTTVLSLLNSFDEPSFTKATKGKWDGENVLIWGHSNGGQIALTVLEVTGENYPTTFWSPVSKPFPYSILYYTDDSDDGGKLLRSVISEFEEDYNVDNYSIHNYFNRINSSIQLHQGTSDDAVPVSWSNQLYNILENNDVEVEYFTYPGTDHNMKPSWDSVVQRDLEFFDSNVRKDVD